ncbi:MAG: hypothetical protein AAF206_13620 [Bacteroidota bacterium]
MTTDEKQWILDQIARGELSEAIETLQGFELSERKKKIALGIAFRYQNLQNRSMMGTRTPAQISASENAITHHLLELIEAKEEHLTGRTHALIPTTSNGNRNWFIIVGIATATLMIFILYVALRNGEPRQQLTIYVRDSKGNVVLEHEGMINTSIGNRPMRETIGEDGMVNFGDILPEFLGDSITIGFQSNGWELINQKNTFLFDGKPVYLLIRRDNSLGIIKGVVKTRDGQDLVEGARVLINADTVVFTDLNGIFQVLLPEPMRVQTPAEAYRLTVSKKGFKTIVDYFYVKSSEAQIRLPAIPSS